MLIEACSVTGAYVITPEPHSDERGQFARAWCLEEFSRAGINFRPVQLNRGQSRRRGTIRGIHYQTAPDLEAKLVWCTRGSIFDVVVDLRADSATLNSWFGLELTPQNGKLLYVPESCGHGCLSMEDDTEFLYLTSTTYAPQSATGVRYDDPAFMIDWPVPVSQCSDQDGRWPLWRF
jgi:dTDP-4-dehydrorhamnose 3,5-epimerase